MIELFEGEVSTCMKQALDALLNNLKILRTSNSQERSVEYLEADFELVYPLYPISMMHSDFTEIPQLPREFGKARKKKGNKTIHLFSV